MGSNAMMIESNVVLHVIEEDQPYFHHKFAHGTPNSFQDGLQRRNTASDHYTGNEKG